MCGVSPHRRVLAGPPELGFTREEIDRMILNAFAGAFLPWPERQALADSGRAGGLGARRRAAGSRSFTGATRLASRAVGRGWRRAQQPRAVAPADRPSTCAGRRPVTARSPADRDRADPRVGRCPQPGHPLATWPGARAADRLRDLRAAGALRPGAVPRRSATFVTAVLHYSYVGSRVRVRRAGQAATRARRDVRVPDPPGHHLRLGAVRDHVLPRRDAVVVRASRWS